MPIGKYAATWAAGVARRAGNHAGLKRANVLVFPCGTELGLELHNALQYCTHARLIGASSIACDHGRYLYRNYFGCFPFCDEPGFIDFVNDFIRQHKIDYVIPAHDGVIYHLGGQQQRLKAKYVGSPPRTCIVCRNKRLTYETFRDRLRIPAFRDLNDPRVPMPVFMKPEVGEGSRGCFLARTREEALFYAERNPGLLALEYLPGEEITVDCFTNRHGELLFVGGRRRIRIVNGVAVATQPVSDPEFERMARMIQSRLELRGAWFFQLKRAEDDSLALLEIAPRIAGSMGLHRNLGVNFAQLSLYDAMGIDVSIFKNDYPIRMDRALSNRFDLKLDYRHVYIDLDDTLIVERQVNPLAIAFLHQCRNRGIELVLITRHNGELNRKLRRYRIETLFDRIILLDKMALKSDSIEEPDAIFIDDSFAERREVGLRRNISTFSPDMIESLMDWRR
ncbi:ATP-grasp domain-containing protein [bacterium]|nr:ATP-grasp domain-containing protein [bacterium]